MWEGILFIHSFLCVHTINPSLSYLLWAQNLNLLDLRLEAQSDPIKSSVMMFWKICWIKSYHVKYRVKWEYHEVKRSCEPKLVFLLVHMFTESLFCNWDSWSCWRLMGSGRSHITATQSPNSPPKHVLSTCASNEAEPHAKQVAHMKIVWRANRVVQVVYSMIRSKVEQEEKKNT